MTEREDLEARVDAVADRLGLDDDVTEIVITERVVSTGWSGEDDEADVFWKERVYRDGTGEWAREMSGDAPEWAAENTAEDEQHTTDH